MDGFGVSAIVLLGMIALLPWIKHKKDGELGWPVLYSLAAERLFRNSGCVIPAEYFPISASTHFPTPLQGSESMDPCSGTSVDVSRSRRVDVDVTTW
jgi:hypothetical protein